MALVGGVIALPMADKAWQSLGGPEMINWLTTKQPIDRERANDHPFNNVWENIEEQWLALEGRIQNFQWRMSGPGEWVEMVTRPELTPAVRDYSVGSMLYIMYEWSPTEQNKYSSFKPTETNAKKMKETLWKLNTPEEKQTFLKLLETSWQRYGEVNPAKISDTTTAKTLTLPNIIDEIDMADSWLNYLPSWAGGTWKKAEVLKIIAPKAKEWWEITIGNLRDYFNPFDEPGISTPDTSTGIGKHIFDLYNGVGKNAEKNAETIKKYLKDTLPRDKTEMNPDTPLRFLLHK